jgi:hypothetical protein
MGVAPSFTWKLGERHGKLDVILLIKFTNTGDNHPVVGEKVSALGNITHFHVAVSQTVFKKTTNYSILPLCPLKETG